MRIEIPVPFQKEYGLTVIHNRFGMSTTDTPIKLMHALAERQVVIHSEQSLEPIFIRTLNLPGRTIYGNRYRTFFCNGYESGITYLSLYSE